MIISGCDYSLIGRHTIAHPLSMPTLAVHVLIDVAECSQWGMCRCTRAGYANGAEEIVFRWSGMWTRKLNAKQKDGDI